jgi:hypothetical protein
LSNESNSGHEKAALSEEMGGDVAGAALAAPPAQSQEESEVIEGK